MFPINYPAVARIIVRPKLAGGGEHFGVQIWDQSVFHLTAAGVEQVFYRDFAAAHSVRTEYTVPACEAVGVMERVQQAMAAPQQYRFLAWNCEHFANWIAGRPARSKQIDGALMVGLVLAGIRLFGR